MLSRVPPPLPHCPSGCFAGGRAGEGDPAPPSPPATAFTRFLSLGYVCHAPPLRSPAPLRPAPPRLRGLITAPEPLPPAAARCRRSPASPLTWRRYGVVTLAPAATLPTGRSCRPRRGVGVGLLFLVPGTPPLMPLCRGGLAEEGTGGGTGLGKGVQLEPDGTRPLWWSHPPPPPSSSWRHPCQRGSGVVQESGGSSARLLVPRESVGRWVNKRRGAGGRRGPAGPTHQAAARGEQ